MQQLQLPGVPVDWTAWHQNVEWRGWTISLSMTGDGVCYPCVYDWTASKWIPWKGEAGAAGMRTCAGVLGAEKEYSSAPAALNQAKEAISMYEDGWRGRMQ